MHIMKLLKQQFCFNKGWNWLEMEYRAACKYGHYTNTIDEIKY